MSSRSRRSAAVRPSLALAAAYLTGAIPFSNVASHLVRGVDLRAVETGTVSGTNLYRVAGFGPLAVAGVLELAKGTVGPLLLGRDHPAAPLAVALSVAGHNWSPLLRGAGGRGFSPAIGGLLVVAPAGAALLLGGLAAGRLARQTAPVSLAAALGLVPLLGALRGRRGAATGALVLAPMLAKRLLGNGRAADRGVYLVRLVHDRDMR